jgi:hypothetical protein
MCDDSKIIGAELETPCEACGGERGHFTEYPQYWKPCGLCNGAGFVPTPFGERVLALLEHNFRPMFERMQNDD